MAASPVIHNSGNNEWYTPREVVSLVHAFFKPYGGIDLDPASSLMANTNIGAKRIYTVQDDGLAAHNSWACDTLFMNPPYGRPLFKQFVDRFLQEYANKAFKRGALLCNNNTETEAGQALLIASDAVLFFGGRLKFLDATNNVKNTPTQGQMLLFFGLDDLDMASRDFCNKAHAMGVLLVKPS